MLVVLLLAALAVTFLVVPKSKQNHSPPGPRGLPFIGNLLQLECSNTHVYFSKLGKTYGSIFTLRFMRNSMVVIQSSELAKEVLRAQEHDFCNRWVTAGKKRLSYNGLDIGLSPYSEYLKEIKKTLVVNLLSSKKVESYAPIREEEVSRLIQKVSSLSSASKTINLSQLVLSYASSSASRIIFGKRYNDEEVLGSRYHRLLHEAENMFTEFFYSDYIFLGGWLDKLTGQHSRLEKIFKELDAVYERIIDDHLNANKLKSKQEDIVDVLIGLMNDTSFPFKLTMDHIKAILLDLFTGGAHTTTAGVIWTMTELVKNPIPMKRVQEELRNAAQNKGYIAENDISKLEYFKAVLKESFRLHPPAPLLIPRETVRKCNIKGYDILPNTTVVINAWAIGRDPKNWKDPEKFMPERFLGSSIELIGNENMIPFGGGRRMCPASTFGLRILELALANLLYSFDWGLPLGHRIEDIDDNVLPGIVTHKKKPLDLVACKF